MAFKEPSSVFQKVMRLKALKHGENGMLTLWDIPCYIMPVHTMLYTYKLMEHQFGKEQAKLILYHANKFQTKTGFDITNKRFGYAKTITDKKASLKFNTGQTEILGMGKYKFTRMNFKNEIFIIKGFSPYAEGFKKFYGLQKEPVDYAFSGSCASAVGSVLNKDCLAVETRCIAMGDKLCEFYVKPVEKWKKNDPLLKNNKILFKKVPSIKDTGCKINLLDLR